MGYYAKAGLGIAVMLGALGLLTWAIVDLVQIGTCASGGPYEIAQECPEGTGTKIGLVFGTVILFLVGVAVFAARGGRPTEPGLPSAATGAGPDWGSLGSPRPHTPPNQTPGVPTVFTNRQAANAGAVRAAAPPPPPPVRPDQGSDAVERLEKLIELRVKGAVSEAEFQAAKTRILGDL
jgi:Short C-terminal domain